MGRPTGTTTWVDFSSTDLDAAKSFYTGMFGWQFEDTGEEFMHYHLIRSAGGDLVGGGMDVSAMQGPDGSGMPSEWGVFLAADDVDAGAKAAETAGGRITFPAGDVADSGRFVVLRDTTGAQFGLWQAGEIEGFAFTGKPGSPVWFELATHDFDAASAFYTQAFGVDLVPMEFAGNVRYATAGAPESATWGLCDASSFLPKEATGWRVYFNVAESESALAKVAELGGRVLNGPVDSPFGRVATVQAPDGATFELIATSEAASR